MALISLWANWDTEKKKVPYPKLQINELQNITFRCLLILFFIDVDYRKKQNKRESITHSVPLLTSKTLLQWFNFSPTSLDLWGCSPAQTSHFSHCYIYLSCYEDSAVMMASPAFRMMLEDEETRPHCSPQSSSSGDWTALREQSTLSCSTPALSGPFTDRKSVV